MLHEHRNKTRRWAKGSGDIPSFRSKTMRKKKKKKKKKRRKKEEEEEEEEEEKHSYVFPMHME
jgi:ribosomal protein L12E/L44/L45/RPP1/RPP2